MKQIALSGTGLSVSVIGLGFWRLGKQPERDIAALLKAAIDRGVTLFDHADIYGQGECEAVFGAATGWTAAQRERYVIQTKCGIRPDPGGKYYDSSAAHILKSVDTSLKRLRTDYIDILLIHRPDALMEPEEMGRAFERLRAEGKVRNFGVSNMRPLQMERIAACAPVPLIASQLQFGLGHAGLVAAGMAANMEIGQGVVRDSDVLDYCRLKGVLVQAWSPLQHGEKGMILDNPALPELNRELETVAVRKGVSKTAVALAWILRIPGVMPVLGTGNPEHLGLACDAAEIELDRQEWYNLFRAAGYVTP